MKSLLVLAVILMSGVALANPSQPPKGQGTYPAQAPVPKPYGSNGPPSTAASKPGYQGRPQSPQSQGKYPNPSPKPYPPRYSQTSKRNKYPMMRPAPEPMAPVQIPYSYDNRNVQRIPYSRLTNYINTVPYRPGGQYPVPRPMSMSSNYGNSWQMNEDFLRKLLGSDVSTPAAAPQQAYPTGPNALSVPSAPASSGPSASYTQTGGSSTASPPSPSTSTFVSTDLVNHEGVCSLEVAKVPECMANQSFERIAKTEFQCPGLAHKVEWACYCGFYSATEPSNLN